MPAKHRCLEIIRHIALVTLAPLTVADRHSEGGERRIKATIRSPAASLLVVPPGSDETFIYGGQSSFREGRGKRGYMREKGLLSMCKSRCGQS